VTVYDSGFTADGLEPMARNLGLEVQGPGSGSSV
jgi:hypothetical protein